MIPIFLTSSDDGSVSLEIHASSPVIEEIVLLLLATAADETKATMALMQLGYVKKAETKEEA